MAKTGPARQGDGPFPQPDLLIAATAAVANLCVATRNLPDFARTGVPAFNPWTGKTVG
jgi:toxin FitB